MDGVAHVLKLRNFFHKLISLEWQIRMILEFIGRQFIGCLVA